MYIFTYSHVYIYLHINIYTYIHVDISTHQHIHIHIYTFTHINIFTKIHKYIYIYIYLYKYKNTYMYTQIYTFTCIHINIYTSTHMHVPHTYIYKNIFTFTHTHVYKYTHIHIYIDIHYTSWQHFSTVWAKRCTWYVTAGIAGEQRTNESQVGSLDRCWVLQLPGVIGCSVASQQILHRLREKMDLVGYGSSHRSDWSPSVRTKSDPSLVALSLLLFSMNIRIRMSRKWK